MTTIPATPASRSPSARHWLAIALLALIWGATFLSLRTVLDELPPATTVTWRVGLAAAILWAVVAARGLAVPRAPGPWAALTVMGLLNNVVPFGLQAWGQQFIPTGLVGILNASTAVSGVLIAALFLPDERLTRSRLAGVALGFTGVATAIGPDALRALDPASMAQLAVVASGLSYALAGVWGRVRLGGMHPLVAAAGMLSCSTILAAPVALWLDGPLVPRAPGTWIALGYFAGGATAGAYLLYFALLRRVGSGNLMLVTLLVAPIAICLGALVRGEVLGVATWAGFAILALGLLVLDGRALHALRRRATPRG